MKNILYIYGLNGSPNGYTVNTLKNLIGNDYKVYSFEYNQNDCKIAREQILNFIKENNIDLVIGSSLGGFITLTLFGICRFVINPCYSPSSELSKLGCDDKMIESYKQFESLFNESDIEEKQLVVGFFGDNDELFGEKYILKFKKDFGNNIIRVNSGHHASVNCLKTIIEYLPEYWERMNIFNKFLTGNINLE